MIRKCIKRFWNRLRFQRTIQSDESQNVVAGMAKARKLYRELIAQAHPDKHPEHTEIAEEFTKRINESRYCYAALLQIKQELSQQLQ